MSKQAIRDLIIETKGKFKLYYKSDYVDDGNELVKYNIPVTYVDWKSEERDIAEMGSEKFEEIVTSGSVKSFTFEDQIKERLFS